MPSLNFVSVIIGIALAGAGVLTAGAAERDWQKLSSARFTIVSQLRENETRDWAAEFDQFVDELTGFLGIEKAVLQPVTVVLFRTRRDFAPYRPARPDGEPADVAGVFASRDTWGVIGLSRGGDEGWIRRVIFHEGVHWIASHDRHFWPLWISEGLAEVFSTFQVVRGNAQWGEPIAAHVTQLRSSPMLPLSQLLRVTRNDPLLNEGDRTGIFYAQSWALVHYLMFGARKDPQASLSAYLRAIRGGASIDDILQSQLGMDGQALQRELHSYMSRGRAFRVKRPVPENAGADFTATVATPGEVAAALARLALGTGNLDLAREQATRAVELEPRLSGAHEVLAWIESMQSRDGPAGAHAERAIATGSRDAWMYLFFAAALQRSEDAKSASAGEVARAVANLNEQALNLNPTFRQAYENLAAQMADVEPLRPADREFLAAGRKIFPTSGRILLGLALIAERDGDRREVARLLEESDAPEVELPGWARTTRDRLRRRYVVEDVEPRVQALVADGQIGEALALYDAAIETATDAFLQRKLKSDRLRLAFETKMKVAQSSKTAGRFGEARQHYREILSWPGLTQNQRSAAIAALRVVDRLRWQQPGAIADP